MVPVMIAIMVFLTSVSIVHENNCCAILFHRMTSWSWLLGSIYTKLWFYNKVPYHAVHPCSNWGKQRLILNLQISPRITPSCLLNILEEINCNCIIKGPRFTIHVAKFSLTVMWKFEHNILHVTPFLTHSGYVVFNPRVLQYKQWRAQFKGDPITHSAIYTSYPTL